MSAKCVYCKSPGLSPFLPICMGHLLLVGSLVAVELFVTSKLGTKVELPKIFSGEREEE